MEKNHRPVHIDSDNDKQVVSLLINYQEQTNMLLEEVINDNRILKQEISILRGIVVKYESLQKDLEDFVVERKECQKGVNLRLVELANNLILINKEVFNSFEKNRNYIVEENLKLHDRINKEIEKITNTIIPIRIDAAKQGAKYGVIVSILVFFLTTLVSIAAHWIEKLLKG